MPRRAVQVAVALGTIAALALIQYPRYVTAECEVLPSVRSYVRAEVDGVIAEIAVEENARVQRGQVLARLEDREIKHELALARAEVARLQAQLDKMQKGNRQEEIAKSQAIVAAGTDDLRFAEQQEQRLQQMLAGGVASIEQHERATHDVEMKRVELARAKAGLALLRAGFRAEDIESAEAELESARAEVAYLEDKLGRFTLSAPIDGRVLTRRVGEKLHERLAAGDIFCELAGNGRALVEIDSPEREFDVIRVGQPVVVKVQSYPLHPFPGVVTLIDSISHECNSGRCVRVVSELEDSEGLLHKGMQGYGEIDTGNASLLTLMFRRTVRWIRVRFLI